MAILGAILYLGAVLLLVLSSAVSKSKTIIDRWVKEYLETGRIESNDDLTFPPLFSFRHLVNVTLNIEASKKFTILRQKKLRGKIRDFKKLKMAKNCVFIGEILFLVLLLVIKEH